MSCCSICSASKLSPVPAPLSEELISERKLVCGTMRCSRCLASTAEGCLGEVVGEDSLAAARFSVVKSATGAAAAVDDAASRSRSRSCASAASALLLLSRRSSLLSSSLLLRSRLSRLRLRLLVPSEAGAARCVPSCAAVPLVSLILRSLASSSCLLSASSSARSSSSRLLLLLPPACSTLGKMFSPGS